MKAHFAEIVSEFVFDFLILIAHFVEIVSEFVFVFILIAHFAENVSEFNFCFLIFFKATTYVNISSLSLFHTRNRLNFLQ